MLRKVTIIIVCSTLLMCFAALNCLIVNAAERKVIAVVRSHIVGPYNDAFLGFKEELKRKGYEALFSNYDLGESEENNNNIVNEINDIKPDMILVLGSHAAGYIKDRIKKYPIIFSMVLNPIENGLAELPGVSLNIGISEQFKKIKELIPDIKYIGLIYDANSKSFLKDEVISAAKKIALDITAKPVYAKKEVNQKLEEISKEADCLWAIIDSFVYNSQSAENILLFTLQNKLPFIAFSSHYVKAGALMALECDYNDIGRQTAQIAVRILTGEKPSSIPIQNPRKTRLIINKKTAEIVGITIPRKILEEADEIYGK